MKKIFMVLGVFILMVLLIPGVPLLADTQPVVLDVPIAFNGDDVCEYEDSGDMRITQTTVSLMSAIPVYSRIWVGLRFPVEIPQGSVITGAYLSLDVTSTSQDDANGKIYVEYAADSLPFADTPGNVTSRTRTTGSVIWRELGVGDGLIQSPDFSQLVQEVVDDFDVTYLTVIIKPNTDRWAWLQFSSFESRTPPILHIEYQGEPPEEEPPIVIPPEIPIEGGVSLPLVHGSPRVSYGSSAVSFQSPQGGGNGYASMYNEFAAQMQATDNYTWQGLYVVVASNNSTIERTVRSKINGEYGNQTVNIPAGATGVFHDTTNTDDLIEGDLFCWAISEGKSSEGLGINVFGSVLKSPNGSTIIGTSRVNAGADCHKDKTQWLSALGMLAVNDDPDTDPNRENRAKYPIFTPTILSNFRVVVGRNDLTTPSTYYLRKNGENTALSVTVPGGAIGAFEDTLDSVEFGSGDLLSYMVVAGTGEGDARIYTSSIQVKSQSQTRQLAAALITPTYEHQFGTTRYYAIEGTNRKSPPGEALEDDVQVLSQVEATVKYMAVNVYLNSLNGPSTFVLRKNEVDTSLSITVPAYATGLFYNLEDTVDILPTDLLNWKVVASGTSGSMLVNAIGAEYSGKVNIAPVQYTITASVDANGSIDPSGDVPVSQGNNQSFSITPDDGYRVADVLVDDVPVGAVTSYNFDNVQENHTIHALFEEIPNVPSSPTPADGAIDVSVDTDLIWIGGDPDAGDTVTYDVYFGTDDTPSLVSSDESGTTYDPGTLEYDTHYYWKIVARDNNGLITEGPLWNFTTTVETGILGEVNGDGLVNSTDALIVLSCDVGIDTSAFCPMNPGDVNDDGLINSTDALIILSHDVGLPIPYPVGQPGYPSDITPCPGCGP